jgi:hypothetical protein
LDRVVSGDLGTQRRRWHALWRDADGRHQRVLGPAWVKDSGKRTARGFEALDGNGSQRWLDL